MDVKIAGVLTDLNQIKLIGKDKMRPDMLEFRIDLILGKEKVLRKIIGQALESRNKFRLETILTIRKYEESGLEDKKYYLSSGKRLELFERLIKDFDYTDIELFSEKLTGKVVRIIKQENRKLILSYHNFSGCPSDNYLNRLFKKARKYKPDLFKLAVSPGNYQEFTGFMNWTVPGMKLIKIAMGKYGGLSRMTAHLFGSEILYGYLGKRPVVAGQKSVLELRKILVGQPEEVIRIKFR